jgi:hypothetical protein
MLYNLQIQKILIQVQTIASPVDKIKLLKEAINIADANNDIEWGVDLRLQIIRVELCTASCTERMPAFTWILNIHDQYPELCREVTFMSEYGYMILTAQRNADVSLDQCNTILEDYKKRLLRNNYTLRSYYSSKIRLAFQRDKLDEVKEYIQLRKAEQRDDLSCLACEIHDLVEYEFRTGGVLELFHVGADIFSGNVRCYDVPFKTICLAVHLVSRFGHDDSADMLFKIADALLYRLGVTDMAKIGDIGRIIYYFTGRNKNIAWELFERFLSWSINCEDYYNFQFSSCVLSLFKGSGTRRLNVSPQVPWYNSSGIYELPVLYDYYRDQAETLAVKFDARNGCTNFIEELNSIR